MKEVVGYLVKSIGSGQVYGVGGKYERGGKVKQFASREEPVDEP